jgi:hypothetical protein
VDRGLEVRDQVYFEGKVKMGGGVRRRPLLLSLSKYAYVYGYGFMYVYVFAVD